MFATINLALIASVSWAAVPPANSPSAAEEELVLQESPTVPGVVELTTESFLPWTSARNRSMVLFYATGFPDQHLAKNNFKEAARVATSRGVNMEWAMVDCVGVEPWICGRIGISGFPPARVVTANESSWNITEWAQNRHSVIGLVAVSHVLTGGSYYQAYESVLWGGGQNHIFHAWKQRLDEAHRATGTTATLVAMVSPNCGLSKEFYGRTLIPLSNDEEVAEGLNVVSINCQRKINAKFCTEHGTSTYPRVKLYLPQDSVLDPEQGIVLADYDYTQVKQFITTKLSDTAVPTTGKPHIGL